MVQGSTRAGRGGVLTRQRMQGTGVGGVAGGSAMQEQGSARQCM